MVARGNGKCCLRAASTTQMLAATYVPLLLVPVSYCSPSLKFTTAREHCCSQHTRRHVDPTAGVWSQTPERQRWERSTTTPHRLEVKGIAATLQLDWREL